MPFSVNRANTWTKNRENIDPISLKNYVTQGGHFAPLLRHITQSRIIVVPQEVADLDRSKSSRREQSPGLICFREYVFSTGGSKDYGRKTYAPMLPTLCGTTSFPGSSYVGKYRGANKQKSNTAFGTAEKG